MTNKKKPNGEWDFRITVYMDKKTYDDILHKSHMAGCKPSGYLRQIAIADLKKE